MLKTTKKLIKDLKKERGELKYKIKKLKRFNNSKKRLRIGVIQQTMLTHQYNIMCCYRDILTARINDIKCKGDTE